MIALESRKPQRGKVPAMESESPRSVMVNSGSSASFETSDSNASANMECFSAAAAQAYTAAKLDATRVRLQDRQRPRTVHKLSPLTSLSDLGCLALPAAHIGGIDTATSLYPLLPGATQPVAIPLDNGRPIQATAHPGHVGAYIARMSSSSEESLMAFPSDDDLSWTKRQMRYPVDEPARQPLGLERNLKARNAAIRTRAAQHASIAARRDRAPQEAAWRFRFKRKWIREELHAVRQDFPDDPSYDDAWADAAGFLEACGPAGALQAAFLEAPAGCEAADELADESSDSILFDEGPDQSPAPRGVASRAAVLVKLQRAAG